MQMLLVSERREGRRAVLVQCQVVREKGFQLLGEAAIDLSVDGMLLPCAVPVLTGEEVFVSLRVPGTDAWIDAVATVARTVHGRRAGDRGRALGLRFESIDSASRRLLRWALRSIPPTVPVRSPRIDYAATANFIALS
jgi:hypothetical protein